MKPVNPAENAAPFYQALPRSNSDDKGGRVNLPGVLLLRPNAAAISSVKEELQKQRTSLALLDKATALPDCNFNRDWSKGLAMEYPEYWSMKSGSRTLGLRGSLAASEGRPEEAIRDFRKMLIVAKHASVDANGLSSLVGDLIYLRAMNYLSLWAYAFPKQRVYLEALSAAVREWPTIDLQKRHLTDLLKFRDILRLAGTKEGRAKLGLEDKGGPSKDQDDHDRAMAAIAPRIAADAQITRDQRLIWEAYGGPANQRVARIHALWADIESVAWEYPNAMSIASNFIVPDNHEIELYDLYWEASRLQRVALLRALSESPIPTHIETSDLRSPFDGKPLRYQFDGHQIRIEVSVPADAKVRPLLLPSNTALGIEDKPEPKPDSKGFAP